MTVRDMKDKDGGNHDTLLISNEKEYQLSNEKLLAAYEELTASEEELRQQFDELLAQEGKIYRQNTVLNLLHDTVIGLIADLNHDDVLKKIICRVVELFNAQNSFVYLVNEDKGTYTLKIGTGVFSKITSEGKITEGLIGLAHRTGKIATVNNYGEWEDRLPSSIFDEVQYCVLVPLKHQDKMIGAAGLGFCEAERKLSEDELFLLQRFADLASLALGNALLVDSLHNEIKERKQAEEARRQQEEALIASKNKLAMAADLASLAPWEYNPETELYDFGDGFYAIYGTDVAKEGRFMSLGTYVKEFVHPEDIWMFNKENNFISQEKRFNANDIWHRIIRRDGEVRTVLVRRSVVRDADGKIIKKYGTNQDITERVQVEEERRKQAETIKHMAYFDSLTGLANRYYLNEWLNSEIERARREDASGVVVFIDLDDLKMVNDTYGHTCGDTIIRKTGARIVDEVGKKAFVARVGGDEFVVILPGMYDRTQIGEIVYKISKSLGQKQENLGISFHMTASIGIAFYPTDGDTTEEIIKNADNAMYAAKKDGKNCWRFYNEAMQTEAYQKMRLTSSLRYALERSELSLVYQPQIVTTERIVTGFEALLRWNSPEYGSVSPMHFIPLAEQSGLIHSIGQWVLRQACQFARRLADLGWSGVHVAVNISSKQIAANDFIAVVRSAVKEAGIQPHQLELEITESLLMTSIEDATIKLAELKDLGVHLSLDDFGTGFSSLTYLRRLPVETLKIDKSFIDMITADAQGAKIIGSIINMAHTIHMNVVAEGVETQLQLEYLADNGCDLIQGYIFSRPVSEAEAIKLLPEKAC